jgi:hypothetical protein
MSDRYSTITREVPIDRPRNTVFASVGGASGELNSQHRVTEHPAGFRVRERGALDAKVVHTYRCYVHGPFDVEVPRSDVPDSVPCPEEDMRWDIEANFALVRCKCKASWAGSSCGIGHAAGEVTC